jgi:transcriptional regulator with XRE-family HTH domain
MKQETLAQAVGYRNRSAISQIEAGLMEPSWEMVQRMAQALGLPLAAFDEEPPAEPPR